MISPLMCTAEEVLAIREGRKTQARQVIEVQPEFQGLESFGDSWSWHGSDSDWFSGATTEHLVSKFGLMHQDRCPYQVGDVAVLIVGIVIEITNVRVQRLQNISEQDATAEGCQVTEISDEQVSDFQISDESPFLKKLSSALGRGSFTAKFDFMMLWDSINGRQPGCAFADNPWVWVIEFRVLEVRT